MKRPCPSGVEEVKRGRPTSTSSRDAFLAPEMTVDLAVLKNYLLGNPLMDWMSAYGHHHFRDNVCAAATTERIEPMKKVNISLSDWHNWVQRYFATEGCADVVDATNVVDVQCDEARTRAAVRSGAVLIMNPALVCASENIGVRPPVLVLIHDGGTKEDTPAVGTYVAVQLCTGKPARWRNRRNRSVILATCAITNLALAEMSENENDGETTSIPATNRVKRASVDAVCGLVICRDSLDDAGTACSVATVRRVDIVGGTRRSNILCDCRRAWQWVRELRTHGHTWSPMRPERWEMTPNMRALNVGECTRWNATLLRIAKETGEMTQLYYCTQEMKRRAFTLGHRNYHDLLHSPLLTERQMRIVWANHRDNAHAAIQPRHLRAEGPTAQTLAAMRHVPWFVTDFETVEHEGRSWIFMIATDLYLPVERRIVHHHVTLRNLTHSEQHALLHAWLSWIEQQMRQQRMDDGPVRMLHWSGAEPRFLESVWRAQRETLQNPERVESTVLHERLQSRLQWVDVLVMFKDNNIAVPGALDFKLKHIARALYAGGKIASTWSEEDNAVADGYGAMQLARHIYTTRRTRRGHERALANIRAYNCMDTRVLTEIALFLQTLLPECLSSKI